MASGLHQIPPSLLENVICFPSFNGFVRTSLICQVSRQVRTRPLRGSLGTWTARLSQLLVQRCWLNELRSPPVTEPQSHHRATEPRAAAGKAASPARRPLGQHQAPASRDAQDGSGKPLGPSGHRFGNRHPACEREVQTETRAEWAPCCLIGERLVA